MRAAGEGRADDQAHELEWARVYTRSPDEANQYPERDKTGRKVAVVAWIVLVLSGVLEAVWATALGKSEGFTKLWPSVIFGVALVVSMGGLAWAMRDIPTSTAYAVWVGIGAALTVIYAMVVGDEPVSWLRILLIMGLVGCVVGLKFIGGDTPAANV